MFTQAWTFTYSVYTGHAKYLNQRSTKKYHAFFMCVCEQSSIGTTIKSKQNQLKVAPDTY